MTRPLFPGDICRIDGTVYADGNYAVVFPNPYLPGLTGFLVPAGAEDLRELDPDLRYTFLGEWDGFNVAVKEAHVADCQLFGPHPPFRPELAKAQLPTFEPTASPDLDAQHIDPRAFTTMFSARETVRISGESLQYEHAVLSHWNRETIWLAENTPWVSYAVCIGHLDDVFLDDSWSKHAG